MKLGKGVIVHIGKEKFVGVIPDDKAKAAGLFKEPKKESEDVAMSKRIK